MLPRPCISASTTCWILSGSNPITLAAPETGKGIWIVHNDFKGFKPNPKFWTNVRQLISLVGGSRLMHCSVFVTGSRRSAMAAGKLVRHYGGEFVARERKWNYWIKLLRA